MDGMILLISMVFQKKNSIYYMNNEIKINIYIINKNKNLLEQILKVFQCIGNFLLFVLLDLN